MPIEIPLSVMTEETRRLEAGPVDEQLNAIIERTERNQGVGLWMWLLLGLGGLGLLLGMLGFFKRGTR